MTRMDVRGKSREELDVLLAGVRRERLYDLIHELATLEEHFTPLELARARRMPKRTIVQMCVQGRIPGTHKPDASKWRISRRGVEQWDASTQVTPLQPAR